MTPVRTRGLICIYYEIPIINGYQSFCLLLNVIADCSISSIEAGSLFDTYFVILRCTIRCLFLKDATHEALAENSNPDDMC